VNGSRLKHYIAGKLVEGKVTYTLPDALSTYKPSEVKIRT